jgi:hypothetical protein
MNNPARYFTRATAHFIAAQNTADDGEWTYKAEPVEGNTAQLYTVTIYDQDGNKIGTL